MAMPVQPPKRRLSVPVEVYLQSNEKGAFNVGEHQHECYELLFFLEGGAQQTLRHETFETLQGDLVLVRAGELHSTRPQTGKMRVLTVKFLPSVLCRSGLAAPRSLDALLCASGHYPLSELPERQYREIRDTFGTLLKEYREQELGAELILTAELYRLAGLLLRFGIVSVRQDGLSAAEHARIERMLRYVEEHGQSGLSLHKLAETFNLNYAYMSRYFKKRMGKTFREYLLGVRTARADLLLQQGEMTIAEVAKETGFTSPQAFSRSYRQIKGYPPSVHKKVN